MSGRFFGFLVLLSSTALAGCASDWEKRYEQSEREKLDLNATLETIQQERAEEAARSEALAQSVKAMEGENQRIREDAALNAKTANEWKSAYDKLSAEGARGATSSTAAAPAATNAELERRATQLRQVYESVTITPDGNIEVTLPSDVTFGSGSTILTDPAKKSLRKLGALLNGEFSPYSLRVEGHTDAQPLQKTKDKYFDNRGLGAARALEVVRFMENEMKMDPRRLTSASKGEHEPVAPNDDAKGRAQNRRVEVVVVIPRESAVVEAK
jgi:chemotaxis protein MotB